MFLASCFANDPQGRFGDVYSAVERASRATKLHTVGLAGAVDLLSDRLM